MINDNINIKKLYLDAAHLCVVVQHWIEQRERNKIKRNSIFKCKQFSFFSLCFFYYFILKTLAINIDDRWKIHQIFLFLLVFILIWRIEEKWRRRRNRDDEMNERSWRLTFSYSFSFFGNIFLLDHLIASKFKWVYLRVFIPFISFCELWGEKEKISFLCVQIEGNIQMKLLVTSNWALTHFHREWFKGFIFIFIFLLSRKKKILNFTSHWTFNAFPVW